MVGEWPVFFNGIHQIADDDDECQEASQASFSLLDAEQRHKAGSKPKTEPLPKVMTAFGTPCQMRVFDSRSYFRVPRRR